jgi:F0F1-type ATP synthase assembly protein I
MKETLGPMALIMRLGAIVITAIFLTLGLGLWIDKQLGSSPCGLLIFMHIGVVISIIGVYRTVQGIYDKYAPPKEEK